MKTTFKYLGILIASFFLAGIGMVIVAEFGYIVNVMVSSL